MLVFEVGERRRAGRSSGPGQGLGADDLIAVQTTAGTGIRQPSATTGTDHRPCGRSGSSSCVTAPMLAQPTAKRLGQTALSSQVPPYRRSPEAVRTDVTRRSPVTILVVAAVTAAIVGSIVIAAAHSVDGTTHHALVSTSLDAPDKIPDASTALRLSLLRVPATGVVHNQLVGELTLGDVQRCWYGGGGASGWMPEWKVWMVGLTVTGLTMDDLLPPPPLPVFREAQARGVKSPTVFGAYYVWSRSSGELVAEGYLDSPQLIPQPWNTFPTLRATIQSCGRILYQSR